MINFKRGIVRYLHLSADKEWKIYGNYKKKIITKPGFHSYPGTYLQKFLGYLVKIVRAISLIIDDHLKNKNAVSLKQKVWRYPRSQTTTLTQRNNKSNAGNLYLNIFKTRRAYKRKFDEGVRERSREKSSLLKKESVRFSV